MNVNYAARAKQSGEAYTLMQKATKWLEEATGKSSAMVRAEWDQCEDEKGQTQFTLRVSDTKDFAMASFSLDELASPADMRYLLIRLWGEVLQARSHRLVNKLLETGVSES